MKHRFTLDGSEALEERLGAICKRATQSVEEIVPAERLQGLLLGGGYGRGEGGVLRTDGEDMPYNDIEFYVFVRGTGWLNERQYGDSLHKLGEKLSVEAGVDVEFKIISREKLQHSPVTMFYYDLVMGHLQLSGGTDLLHGCDHHRDATQIPAYEALRLLMNRCSGLLFARERLERSRFTPEDADFVRRNLAKAQLAFGDVVLTILGQYHWSCSKRSQQLDRLFSDDSMPWLIEIKEHHRAGVVFKLHPWKSEESAEALKPLHADLSRLGLELWLWLEQRRLGRAFGSTRDYALGGGSRCPETQAWRNIAVNVKSFGPKMLLNRELIRYPRERLLRSLPLLLWESNVFEDSALLSKVQKNLAHRGRSLPELVSAYDNLWRKFN